jgi:hypothetical protein
MNIRQAYGDCKGFVLRWEGVFAAFEVGSHWRYRPKYGFAAEGERTWMAKNLEKRQTFPTA